MYVIFEKVNSKIIPTNPVALSSSLLYSLSSWIESISYVCSRKPFFLTALLHSLCGDCHNKLVRWACVIPQNFAYFFISSSTWLISFSCSYALINYHKIFIHNCMHIIDSKILAIYDTKIGFSTIGLTSLMG